MLDWPGLPCASSVLLELGLKLWACLVLACLGSLGIALDYIGLLGLLGLAWACLGLFGLAWVCLGSLGFA